jgi:hypothetical protein
MPEHSCPAFVGKDSSLGSRYRMSRRQRDAQRGYLAQTNHRAQWLDTAASNTERPTGGALQWPIATHWRRNNRACSKRPQSRPFSDAGTSRSRTGCYCCQRACRGLVANAPVGRRATRAVDIPVANERISMAYRSIANLPAESMHCSGRRGSDRLRPWTGWCNCADAATQRTH